MKKIYFFISIIIALIAKPTYSQCKIDDINTFLKNNFTDSLKKIYLKNKVYPKELEKPIFIALYNYPELINICIEFKFKKIKTTMAAQPAKILKFKNKNKRNYKILINNKNNEISYKLLDDSELAGVFGHETAHILDYTKKTNIEMLSFGLKYLFSKKFKYNIEHKTDSITIYHCLGNQLYSFGNFIQKSPEIKKNYKEKKSYFYLKPEEIRNILDIKH